MVDEAPEGEVYLYLSPKVMRERRIKDMDMVRVYNHMGEWFARAKEWPGLPPDVVFYRAWLGPPVHQELDALQ